MRDLVVMMAGRHDAAFSDSLALASLVLSIYAKDGHKDLERYNPAQTYRKG